MPKNANRDLAGISKTKSASLYASEGRSRKARYAEITIEPDYDRMRELIALCTWTFAKTMPQCPHEYFVRHKCQLSDEESLYFVNMQRWYGIHERWGPYNHPDLHIDGHKYWTMGDTYESTVIIKSRGIKYEKHMSHSEYLKEKLKEINYSSPYLQYSDDSRYLYVTKTFSWCINPTYDTVILHDSTIGIAKYAGWSERPIRGELFIRCPDLIDRFPQPKFIEMGDVNVAGKDVINNMFDCNPQITNSCFDTDTYSFMKSGEKRRYLFVESSWKKLFMPFVWLWDIVDTKY